MKVDHFVKEEKGLQSIRNDYQRDYPESRQINEAIRMGLENFERTPYKAGGLQSRASGVFLTKFRFIATS